MGNLFSNNTSTAGDFTLLKDKNWRLANLYKITNEFGKLVTFNKNPAQEHFTKNKHTRNIILKSRRLGFTTFSAIDMLDNTLFNENWNSLFISYDDQSSKKVFDEMVMLAWLHFALQQIYKVDLSNANQLKLNFGDNTFSSIEVKSSGRGGRYNHIHISEFAKICAKYPQKAVEIMTGSIPALTPNGFLTIESTAEGDQSDFHDMYWSSVERANSKHQLLPHEYKPHFYNWQWDQIRINHIKQPDAQIPKQFLDYQKQHNEKAKKMPLLYQPITDIQLTYWFYKYIELNSKWSRLLQEFPTTAEEAFQHSGSKLFDQLKLEKQKQFQREPIAQVGDWKLYEEPAPNHIYVVGADPSEGTGNDHSAAAIIDFTPKRPRVVATYANNMIQPDLFAFELKTQARAYNYALVMVERNNSGHATLTQLKQIYPPEYIYKEEREQTETTEQTEKLGWHTNLVTKPRMFYDLSTAVNEELIELVSQQLIHEARMYDRGTLQKTKADPEATNHFDSLTATAIAFQGRTAVAYASQEIITTTPASSKPFDRFAAV